MIYDTLANIWAASTIQPIPVVCQDGTYALITTKANNGWFYGKPMASNSKGYSLDSSSLLVNGSDAMWQAL